MIHTPSLCQFSDICKYHHDLSSNHDNTVMFDTLSDKIVWMSEKFIGDFNHLSVGSSLSSTCDAITKSKDQSLEMLNLVKKSLLKNIRQEYSCHEYVIEIFIIEKKVVVLRLNKNQNNLLANTRYLEDREKLLFTSRSITVSEMASTLAHEINQPIGTINNLLYGLRARLNNIENIDHEIINAIDKSIEQTKFTADIITRIRDYTQTRQPKLSNVNIKSLIAKCISLMDWEMRNTNVEISHYNHICDVIVYGDELMLQQVIVNLIRNGMDANIDNNKKNKIIIHTTLDNNNIKISIEDNGKGMTDEEASNIFIPFASNKSSGMGIGLNICRSFIELHKGKLWLTKNNNRGCTSHIMLPLLA